MERESGFYWVEYEGEWQPAHFEAGVWLIVGDSEYLEASEFSEIGERIERKESK